jgi:hypothetical protein
METSRTPNRSASGVPKIPARMYGSASANATTPTFAGSSVVTSTSHGMARNDIREPTVDTSSAPSSPISAALRRIPAPLPHHVTSPAPYRCPSICVHTAGRPSTYVPPRRSRERRRPG